MRPKPDCQPASPLETKRQACGNKLDHIAGARYGLIEAALRVAKRPADGGLRHKT